MAETPVTPVRSRWIRAPWLRHALIDAAVVALLIGCAVLVYYTGGNHSPYTYLTLVPVLIGAVNHGLVGGLAVALLGAVALGPFMPAAASVGASQNLGDWGVRAGVFLFAGAITGGLVSNVRREIHSRLAQARVDPMTGLPNRVALADDTDELLGSADDRAGVAVVLLRATDLSEVVDVVGIEGGDRVLLEIARHLERIAPEVVRAYRFSETELALLVKAERPDALKRIARTVKDAAGASIEIDDAPVRIEPVLGIGHSIPDDVVQAHEYIRRARVAVRRADARQLDWVTYEPRLDSNSNATVELIATAEAALAAGEFELHYQPKVALGDRRPQGAEALVRWRRPDEGLVPPGSFIPKLENTSLIDTFTRFVMREAADFARAGDVNPVSINFAPRNLVNDELINELIRDLRETGTPPENVEVEVTESALMRDPESAIRLLSRLRDHGIGVSLDDFGTGYSSFAYLRRLPATNLKIDRSFVRPMVGDPKSRRLIVAMTEAGHSLGMSVTVEGIETEEQADIAAELGCDLGQGFLWSRAVPAEQFREWVRGHTARDGHPRV